MSKKLSINAVVIVLVGALVAPTAFFVAPQKIFAASSAVTCLKGMAGGAGSGAASAATGVPVSSSAILAQTTVAASATTGNCVYTAILVPIARKVAQKALKKITASTIKFINGSGGNSSGQPSYVPNLAVHLQGAGDSAALSFINKTKTALSSSFSVSISNLLQEEYMQNTSLAGFFGSSNKSNENLKKSSPNVDAFLKGDWSNGGGTQAWLALTTKPKNNPYTLYQAAENKLASQVSQIVTNRRQDLMQAAGFLSWCGGETTRAPAVTASSTGANPQSPCTNPDGTPAKASTPGSIISEYSKKAVVATGMDQLVNINDLDEALGAIVSALANQVLGGAQGLLGASESSGVEASIALRLQNDDDSNGSTASPAATSVAQSMLNQVDAYVGAWNTIATSARTASTSVASLIGYCNSQLTEPNASLATITTQITAAQTALSTEIAPVLAQAQTFPASVAETRALALKLQNASTGSLSGDSAGQISSDVAALVTMPPSASDVVAVQENASAQGGARANPDGSLVVSGGSVVDRMNLITTNAVQLKAVCTPTLQGGAPLPDPNAV